MTRRVVIARGGNAMTGPDGSATPGAQRDAIAEVVAAGVDVVLTHGNGPQVGNLLVKNEIAATVVPPVPLDWCGAQTQATLGFILLDALDQALRLRGADRQMAAIVTRTLVDRDDTGFSHPTKPMVAWVCAPHQSSGTGGTTVAASSFFTSRLPTCGPLPWVSTTSTPAATRSATRCIAMPIAWSWSSGVALPPGPVMALPPRAMRTRMSRP